jgi:hypothetical protein
VTSRRRADERHVKDLAEDLMDVIVLTFRLHEDDYERIARKLYEAGWRNIRRTSLPRTAPAEPVTYTETDRAYDRRAYEQDYGIKE